MDSRNKWLMPSDQEKLAVALANQCKTFIAKIRNVKTNRDARLLVEKYSQLKTAVLDLLNNVNASVDHVASAAAAIASEQIEIKSYYYLYLLQQVSRFNQFVSQSIVSITDKRNPSDLSAPVKLNVAWAGFDELKNVKIEAIFHPLLNQPTHLAINATVSNEETFRDVYADDDEGTRYYYHERNTPHGHPHQDRAHYKKANTNIAIPTQLSNAFGLLTPKFGQLSNQYFKLADDQAHQSEKKLFKSAIANIQAAQPLSPLEQHVLAAGKYYRYQSPVKFGVSAKNASDADHQITHLGHASEFISLQNTIPLNVCIDPLHYQSGTGGIIGAGGKIFYDRQTAPAFATDAYPGVNVVIISHNHYDHMCKRSLVEAFSHSNTLFIVPVGDAKHLRAFGMTNVIELGSWNDVVTITLTDTDKNSSSTYEIRSLPANHASNRSMFDLFESLYMGYMLRDVTKKEIILCTGDTAVLSDEHFAQLEAYLLKHDVTIKTACIAHGPDRPRQWMECTHQSTADALTMHAKFIAMNAKVLAKRKEINDLSFAQLKTAACYAIGYHQGCYRLGVLSFSDVDTTILRTLAVLASFGNETIATIGDRLDENIFYSFMDKFEQTALVDTINVYKQLNNHLMAKQVVELITSHLNIPQPGYRADFSQAQPYAGFVFDYERLIVNRNPGLSKHSPDARKGAFEEYCAYLNPSLYAGNIDPIQLVKKVLTIYLELTKKPTYKPAVMMREFLQQINDGEVDKDNVETKLAQLNVELHPQQDEGVRNEGHSYTALTIIAGLIHFPEFREKMRIRQHELLQITQSGVRYTAK